MTAQSGMGKPLPERCLRGLSKPEYLERDQDSSIPVIVWKAFEPHFPTRQDRISRRGKSDHYELSVNWEDQDAKSFQTLCEDKKNAGHGILSICFADLEKAKQVNPLAAESLDWERDEIKGNPFHGNLLFSGNLSRSMIRELAAVVASHVRPNLILIEPENYDSELAARTTQTTAANRPEHLGFWESAFAWVRTKFKL